MSIPARLNPGLIAGVFSFVLAVAFVPWWSAAADTPRWAVVALAAGAAALWCPAGRWRTEHWLWSTFLIAAAVSLLWSAGPYEGADQLAKLLFLAAIFRVGAVLPSLRPVYIGLALGFAVNGAVAIAQVAGWTGIIPQISPPAGLFMNKNYLAEPAAMLLVALIAYRLRWCVFLVLPAVLLPGARGALAGLAVAALAWIWTQSRIGAVVLAGFGVLAAAALLEQGYGGPSMAERVQIWQATIDGMTWTGNGLGSFRALFPSHAPDFNLLAGRPSHAHNDFLEMAYELGPGALLYLAIIVLALCGPNGAEKLVLIVFLTEGCFGFPLHFPVPAALAALVAGRLCRERVPLRLGACFGGTAIRRRLGAGHFARRQSDGARPREASISARPSV